MGPKVLNKLGLYYWDGVVPMNKNRSSRVGDIEKKKRRRSLSCGVTARRLPPHHPTTIYSKKSERKMEHSFPTVSRISVPAVCGADGKRYVRNCMVLETCYVSIRLSGHRIPRESSSLALQIQGRAKFLRPSQACSHLILTDLSCCNLSFNREN